jgi:lactoylglutathione lyase
MSNVHVHLHVSNIEESRVFYEKFFGSSPVKIKPGYVKFLPSFAPVNLALSEGATGKGSVDHLGIQVESPELVQSLLGRVKAEGLSVQEEMCVDCCFANQDKFWVQDPDGVEWEVYYLNRDVEQATAPKPPAEAVPTMCSTSCPSKTP